MAKILILQPAQGRYFLRTIETATKNQQANAEYLGIELASQRGNGIDDVIVGQPYATAKEAIQAAGTMKAKPKIMTARMLAARTADAVEAES